MDTLRSLINIFLHLDRVLTDVAAHFGIWAYVILFVVIFCETGLVVTPFLPGDSLIFAVGALAAVGGMKLWVAFPLLLVAAIVGDAVNYSVGHNLGIAFFNRPGKRRYIDPAHLEQAKDFYARYGNKTILFARFVPIVRTLAPFVAGVAQMTYAHFALYNIIGAVAWVSLCLFGGYFFGNIPMVKENFSLVVIGIIVVSIVPAVVTWLRERSHARQTP